MKLSGLIIAIGIALCLTPPARADEVIKKDGSKIVGFIVEDTKASVLIMDADGRRHRVRRSEIETVIEGPETGSKAIDAKIAEIDAQDADALLGVAKWAKEANEKGWRLVAMQITRLDANHAGANELLGRIRVGDQWFDNQKDADAARKALIEKERTEAGYIKWKGGWIQKDDQAKAQKAPDDWMKDETDTWVETAVHMSAKGFIKINNKWVKAGTPEDKADMEEYANLTGGKIWIYTSDHFRLWVEGFEPDEIYEQSVLIEKTWDWFHETFGVRNDGSLWRGNKANIFVFQSPNSRTEWFNKYRNRFGLDDGFLDAMNRSGGVIAAGGLLAVNTVPNRPETKQRLPHSLVNNAAQFLIAFYSPGLPVPQGFQGRRDAWLPETFGVYTEHVMLKNGIVLHTERQRYDGAGGVASKEFATSDAGIAAKGAVRDGSATPMDALMKIQLNTLTADHIAKGFTLFKWWMDTRKDDVKKWLEMRNTVETEEAIQKVFGVTLQQLDTEWGKHVRQAY